MLVAFSVKKQSPIRQNNYNYVSHRITELSPLSENRSQSYLMTKKLLNPIKSNIDLLKQVSQK